MSECFPKYPPRFVVGDKAFYVSENPGISSLILGNYVDWKEKLVVPVTIIRVFPEQSGYDCIWKYIGKTTDEKYTRYEYNIFRTESEAWHRAKWYLKQELEDINNRRNRILDMLSEISN